MARKVSLLDPWISHEKTLVITCHECPFDFSIGQTEQVFIYTCLGGTTMDFHSTTSSR